MELECELSHETWTASDADAHPRFAWLDVRLGGMLGMTMGSVCTTSSGWSSGCVLWLWRRMSSRRRMQKVVTYPPIQIAWEAVLLHTGL